MLFLSIIGLLKNNFAHLAEGPIFSQKSLHPTVLEGADATVHDQFVCGDLVYFWDSVVSLSLLYDLNGYSFIQQLNGNYNCFYFYSCIYVQYIRGK